MPTDSGDCISELSTILTSDVSLNKTPKDDDRIPVFLTKLWSIVNDPDLDYIVKWDKSGLSFHIQDSAVFSKDILPQYFKHNNLNSCIRQLNMYGFRKITAMDKKNIVECPNPANHLEFFHSYFVRDRYDLLLKIKRKTPSSKSSQQSIATTIENVSNNVGLDQFNRTTLMEEIKQIGKKQIETEKHILTLKHQNETIWKEINILSTKCKMQQRIIKKLCSIITILGRGNQQPKIIKPKRLLAIPEKNSYNVNNNNLLIMSKDECMENERHDEVKYLKNIFNNIEGDKSDVVSISDNRRFFNQISLTSKPMDDDMYGGNSYPSMNVQTYNSPIQYSNEMNNHSNPQKIKVSRVPINRISLHSNQKMTIKNTSIKNNCVAKVRKGVSRDEHSIVSKQAMNIESNFYGNSTSNGSKIINDDEYGYIDLESDFLISESTPEVDDGLIDHMLSEDYLC
uniref:HSF_DOMAIN domain-containing protein n=1 Tax=Strongyloides venezuelensis TaxID=75913 RepID=A0A0K0F673_STRVS